MSLLKLGYSAESLRKRKIENLEKDLESQTKLVNIKFMDMSNNLEKRFNENNTDVEKIQFNNGVNAKVFLDINKNIADIKINFMFL